MIVVIAVDSFKGTIGAADAAEALAAGWFDARPHDVVRLLPMADGGERTIDAFASAVPDAARMPVTVTGPAGEPVATSWLLLPPSSDAPAGTAVVELASTSGIELLGAPPRLRPLDADTRGFGEAIAAALAHGVSRLVLGIGSSASTDGGTGMLTALGARILDSTGRPTAPGARGLADIATVDLSGLPRHPAGGIRVLSDVTNPLTGSRGAASVFGPQKGVEARDVPLLDEGLSRLATLLGVDPQTPGAGAAGGTGAALLAWGATLAPGADAVSQLIGLPAAVAGASVVITGEGAYDGQSANGKVPSYVGRLAASDGTPVALVAGRTSPDASTAAFAASVSLTELAGSVELAMRKPKHWLRLAGAALAEQLAPDAG